ncbi:MAG: hypothetical protein ACOVT5_03345 [Armatimonadaceae bacterium]
MSRRVAFTLAELMVGLTISTLLLLSTLAILSAAARGMARSQTVVDTTRQARQGMESALSQIRGADAVLPIAILHGTEYRTNATTVVMRAPAYSLSQAETFSGESWDLVALQWDPAQKVLIQTVHRAVGSDRPQSNRRVIARNVSAVQWKLNVRDKFDWTRPSNPPLLQIFHLNMVPSAMPNCLVNGSAGIISVRDRNIVWIPTPAASGMIQFLYPVDPASMSGTAPTKVSQVALRLAIEQTSPTGQISTTTLDGLARLRNHRH